MVDTTSSSAAWCARCGRGFVLALVLLLTAAVLLSLPGCGRTDEGSSGASGSERSTSVATADSVSTGAAVPSGTNVVSEARLPVLLDLGADKCVACKAMAPILEEMRGTFEGQLDVRFTDVWKNAEAAREHGVRVIPTQIFFDENGNELFRHQGFFSREDMLAKWSELGYDFDE